ncbi:hypothetical protein P7K49_022351 [Saguinus oedipus]|uniref:Uncharacterized protein n=1 Tax=Saguinus oedipus TaxID=9490 RepID=A0ABQ9UX01_SAGOE|nr:hypothetical protein P7K49_022351 [Saguinus oedipus]
MGTAFTLMDSEQLSASANKSPNLENSRAWELEGPLGIMGNWGPDRGSDSKEWQSRAQDLGPDASHDFQNCMHPSRLPLACSQQNKACSVHLGPGPPSLPASHPIGYPQASFSKFSAVSYLLFSYLICGQLGAVPCLLHLCVLSPTWDHGQASGCVEEEQDERANCKIQTRCEPSSVPTSFG